MSSPYSRSVVLLNETANNSGATKVGVGVAVGVGVGVAVAVGVGVGVAGCCRSGCLSRLPIGPIITVVCEPGYTGAVGVHYVYLVVAVTAGSECYAAAIGRPVRLVAIAGGIVCEPGLAGAVGVHHVYIRPIQRVLVRAVGYLAAVRGPRWPPISSNILIRIACQPYHTGAIYVHHVYIVGEVTIRKEEYFGSVRRPSGSVVTGQGIISEPSLGGAVGVHNIYVPEPVAVGGEYYLAAVWRPDRMMVKIVCPWTC